MNNISICIENLSKQYRIGQSKHYKTLREMLTETMYSPIRRVLQLGNGHPSAEEQTRNDIIWALKDVSFVVNHGEVVGIIGPNGAGKSTLLKILTRITEPTKGYADIYGRVGSLLEVGTGFHSELSGRENIYLSGAILGMKKAEIDRKFDEIVAFAEIEKFLDTPVKRYSSGMHVRLGFAVAAHLEPEILLVDEVLAVGDAAFQKKCLGKMNDVAKSGRTVLFVSHNMVAVQGLCDRVIWVESGRVKEVGEPSRVVSSYLQTSYSSMTEQVWKDKKTAPGNEKVLIHRACVRPLNGSASDPITTRMPFVLEFDYWNLEPEAHLNLSLEVYNEQGTMVFNAGPVELPVWQDGGFPLGLFRDVGHIPGDLLNDGLYWIDLLVVKNSTEVIYRHPRILVFNVHDTPDMRGVWYGKWPGAVRPILKWHTELIELD